MRPGAHLVFVFSLLSWAVVVFAQGSATLWTSFSPLAVRSPYLSCWQNTVDVPLQGNNDRAPSLWPFFQQTPSEILGWAGLIRIDGNQTYKWLGAPGSPGGLLRPVLTNIQITPTRTIMNMTAGPMDLTITYLSPIEPSDPVKQSLPITYTSLEARSNDGQAHAVQVYSDISAEWSSGNRKDQVQWDTIATDQVIFHEVSLVASEPLQENGQQAEDTTTFYGMQMNSSVTYQSDTDVVCRGQFNSSGSLTGEVKPGPGIINSPFQVFAVAVDLGTIQSTTQPVTWTLGMLRDPVVAYGTSQSRSAYWRTAFDNMHDAFTAAIDDFENATQRASALDTRILQDAAKISPHYADLVALSARQAMAGTELTVGVDNGQINATDVKMFMKNVGSDDRVNPVEMLYSSFPYFLYINATYAGYLLEPVIEYAGSSAWTFNYAPMDIGTNYPNATGHNEAHNEEVEQSGNMLIMSLAYARTSGDGAFLTRHYDVLKTWADYLVNNTLPVPSTQLTADGVSKANSTNLAIKGMIGIKAMSQISQVLKMDSDFQHYVNVATQYVDTWKSLAVSTDSSAQHILSNYGSDSSSWTLPYNLFADKWLKTDLVPESLYQSEGTFLQQLIASGNPNGLSWDSNSAVSKPSKGNTAWALFAASVLDDTNAREGLIDPIWAFASTNHSNGIFPLINSLDSPGNSLNTAASPGVGGIFAPLAMNIANVSINVPAGSIAPPTKHSSNVGAIAGGVIAAIVGVVLLTIAGIYFWRRSHRPQADLIEKAETGKAPDLIPYEYSPQPFELNRPDADAIAPESGEEARRQAIRVEIPNRIAQYSKAREANQQRYIASAPSSSFTNSTDPVSSVEPRSSRDALTRSDTRTASAISPQEVIGLRTEVENLRRVMQSFQNDRFDPPPEYEGEGEASGSGSGQ